MVLEQYKKEGKMKRVGYILIVVSMVWLTACAPQPTEPPAQPTEAPAAATEAPAAETKTMVIGYTASVTGKLEVSAGRQAKGLQLWMNQVNEAGGITLMRQRP
jgi:branched-chain amino acid transport system substrate-binding protein